MKAILTNDEKFIRVIETKPIEMEQLKISFTRKIPNWFIIKKKMPWMNINSSFINEYGFIPAGLWLHLSNVCKKFNYELEFLDDFNCKIKNCSMNFNDYNAYIKELFKNSEKIKPYNHQIEGSFSLMKYKKCCGQISTGAGKTLMGYMMFKYLTEKINTHHMLYITPSTDLTNQTAEKFLYYNEICSQKKFNYGIIHSDIKRKKTYKDDNIVFGNYQSLCKMKKSFFDMFDVVFVDECAHAKADSIKNIIIKCSNAKYIFGVTGTFPKDDTYESLVIQSYIGPVIYTFTSYELINDAKQATPVYACGFLLDYLDDVKKESLYNIRGFVNKDNPDEGSKVLNIEKEVARNSYERLNFICNLIKKTTKNTLVLFSDVKNEYGRKIYNNIKETTDKQVFYIDGGISGDYRDNAKQTMEEDKTGNTIIIASIGTYGEGIDIANLWNIILVESTKSDGQIGQILGRGMRQYPGKDKVILIDIGDDFRYGKGNKNNNYLYKHFKEREKIYKARKFPYTLNYFDLKNNYKNKLF